MSDIHYDVRRFDFNKRIEFIKYAHSICKHWWLDIIDFKISCRREPVQDISFEDALKRFTVDEKLHFVVIHRDLNPQFECLEVSLGDFKSIPNYLWVNVDVSRIPEICKDLKVRTSI